MKKIVIPGGQGMVGSMLAKVAGEKGYEVIALGQSYLDITNEVDVLRTITELKPDFVVNCAAYTNVEMAEDEGKDTNFKVNADAPGYLAKACKNNNIPFVHISTDYVFSGDSDTGYTEDLNPGENQLNEYAKAKRQGEIQVRKLNPDAYIVRTSWVFGPNGKNFIDVMLMLSETKTELNMVNDEFGVPTYTKDITNQILHILERTSELAPGFYHAVSEGSCSRFEQAEKIFALAGKVMKLNPVPLSSYPRKAKVPHVSILKNTKLPKLQTWDKAIEEYINSK